MNGTDLGRAIEPGSAYTSDPRIATSEHFTHVGALGRMITVSVSTVLDPLGFSYERMLQGEADMKAGRVRTLAEVMDALRARIREHGG